MRASEQDMFPSSWELAPTQSLAGVNPDRMVQQEKDFFVIMDGIVYSEEFATKAQAMKSVSLGQVSRIILWQFFKST